MRLTEVGTPVASAHGDDAQLGDNDSRADGRGDFLGGLDAEADVAVRVADDDDGLESRTLTGTGLLLDRLDLYSGEISRQPQCLSKCMISRLKKTPPQQSLLPPSARDLLFRMHPARVSRLPYLHDLVLEVSQEVVHNLVLLDGQRVQVDLLHAVDLAGLDQAAQLGDGLPLLLLALPAAASSATATSSTAVTRTTAVTTSGLETAAAGSSGTSTTRSGAATISHYERLERELRGKKEDVVVVR